MSAKSARAKSTGLDNRLEFELAVDRISYLQLEINDLANERDKAVQEAQQLHAKLIAELEDEKKAKLALCEKFAEAHRADLLTGSAKSAETPLSRWGFRTGMPQLKTLSKWTWEQVTAELEKHNFRKWLRVKKEPAKDLMLAAHQRRPERMAAVLKCVGVRVAQSECFYIEAKVDTAAPVKGGA